MPQIDTFLKNTVELGASDLHVPTGSPPLVRQNGALKRFKMADLTAQQTRALLYEVLSAAQRARFEADLEIDFAYEIQGLARFRANAFTQRRGIDLCFRTIKSPTPGFEQLGLPEVLKKQLDHHQGLILVTGGAGAGKSTTLASMVDHINSTRPQHVLTAEDPIETVHPIKKGAVNQRELGRHTRSYGNALKAATPNKVDVKLSAKELEDRRRNWKAPPNNYQSGVLRKYADQVGPALKGAVTHAGGKAEVVCYADI